MSPGCLNSKCSLSDLEVEFSSSSALELSSLSETGRLNVAAAVEQKTYTGIFHRIDIIDDQVLYNIIKLGMVGKIGLCAPFTSHMLVFLISLGLHHLLLHYLCIIFYYSSDK